MKIRQKSSISWEMIVGIDETGQQICPVLNYLLPEKWEERKAKAESPRSEEGSPKSPSPWTSPDSFISTRHGYYWISVISIWICLIIMIHFRSPSSFFIKNIQPILCIAPEKGHLNQGWISKVGISHRFQEIFY